MKVRKCFHTGQWSGQGPSLGYVSLTNTTVSNQALYKCDRGLGFIGNDLRTCWNNGEWSRVALFVNISYNIKYVINSIIFIASKLY